MTQSSCPDGHVAPIGARFCPECGATMIPVASDSGSVPAQETDPAWGRRVAQVHDVPAPSSPEADRPTTTEETAASTGAWGEPFVGPVAEGDRPVPEVAHRRSRRKIAIAALLALVLG